MSKKNISIPLIPFEQIESKIYLIGGKKVMLDKDLASMYGVLTKALNQAVRRNLERFPSDFMFQLSQEEAQEWLSKSMAFNNSSSRSQSVTLKKGHNIKYLPYAFTEQEVAMLSSVLNSKTAILVNIQIIRAFVKMKEVASSYKDLWIKIGEMEKKYDSQFQVVFKAIKLLLEKPKSGPNNRLGSIED